MSHASLAERLAFGSPLDVPTATVAPRPGTALCGRILIAAIFLVSGSAKIFDHAGTTAYMVAQGIPAAGTLAYVAGLAEILGALAILAGFLTRLGALGLIVFLVPTTLLFHDFWAFTGTEQRTQMVSFLKNVTIIGGLSMLVAYGPGRYSVDAKLRAPEPT